MKILHLFSGYNTFSERAHLRKHYVYSVDITNYKNCLPSSITCDFMDFDFYKFPSNFWDFILVGFPCTTFSKASGNFHFKDDIPITDNAKKSILMIDRLVLLLQHFECEYMIENPTSALFSNYHFKKVFNVQAHNLIRLHQINYGHCTFKQTDLLTNKHTLWLNNPVHRVNGKYSKIKFDNLTLKKKQSYPPLFCDAILDFIEK